MVSAYARSARQSWQMRARLTQKSCSITIVGPLSASDIRAPPDERAVCPAHGDSVRSDLSNSVAAESFRRVTLTLGKFGLTARETLEALRGLPFAFGPTFLHRQR